MDTIDPPRQIQKQITVMGKNGPETLTVTETVNGGGASIPYVPVEPFRSLPRDASPGEKLTTRPKVKETVEGYR